IEPKKNTFSYLKVDVQRTQLPIAPSYAITVHKSQSLTLDRAAMDLSDWGHVCGAGLAYTALSRVRNLESLILLALDPSKLYCDPAVIDEYARLAALSPPSAANGWGAQQMDVPRPLLDPIEFHESGAVRGAQRQTGAHPKKKTKRAARYPTPASARIGASASTPTTTTTTTTATGHRKRGKQHEAVQTLGGAAGRPPGIANIGNTCYQAAVSQCLAACPEFVDRLSAQRFMGLESATSTVVSHICALRPGAGEVDPTLLHSRVGSRAFLATRGQQDAMEFLRDGIFSDLRRLGQTETIVDELFFGLHAIALTCSMQGCTATSTQTQLHPELLLYPPADDREDSVALADLLAAHLEPAIQESEWTCPHLHTTHPLRTNEIVDCGRYLIIQVSRFSSDAAG